MVWDHMKSKEREIVERIADALKKARPTTREIDACPFALEIWVRTHDEITMALLDLGLVKRQ